MLDAIILVTPAAADVVLGLAEVDPLAKLPTLDGRPETANTPVTEVNDIERMLVTCDSNSMEGARDAAIISLLRCTGMRRGELIALEWSDIDFGDNSVHLRHQTTKSGKGRVVAFDTATRRALHTYRRRVDQRELDRGRDLTSWHSRLWVSKNGILSLTGVISTLTASCRENFSGIALSCGGSLHRRADE